MKLSTAEWHRRAQQSLKRSRERREKSVWGWGDDIATALVIIGCFAVVFITVNFILDFFRVPW